MQEYTSKEVFNQRFVEMNSDEKVKNRETTYDNWLADYEAEIEKCETAIVDLGCGLGNNTYFLIGKGKEVLACDYSEVAIETLQKDVPQVKTKLFDMAQKFPIENNYTDIVIADLSLHYFTEEVTKKVIVEIKRILKPNGVLLFRVNSIHDDNYMLKQNTLDKDFFWEETQQKSKRVFQEKNIREFFADWKIEKVKEEKMLRYELEKIVWNCAVRKM